MDNRPIGLLDSGVGGLTVAKELFRQLPNEEIIYIGDSKRAPYGSRQSDEIKQFTWEMINFLLSKDVKMIVMACNTATAIVLDEVKEKLSIPVLGVILPGASCAIQKTKNKKIGVIATEATINSQVYQKTIHLKSPSITTQALACPEFVTLVEANDRDSAHAKTVVSDSLASLDKSIDTLILGCTHYPLLAPLIQEVVGDSVRLVDSGSETIRDVSILLNYFLINGHEREHLIHQFYTTADSGQFKEIAENWLEIDKIEVAEVDLSKPNSVDEKQSIIIATRNEGKLKEFQKMFAHLGYIITSLKDYPELPDIAETGMTFEENARLKAETIAKLTGQIVIGDDSGLCVDVLGGLPGIWSHRFAGADPTDEQNIAKLLHELASTELAPERRKAHFHTTLVVAKQDKESLVVEADWNGSIATQIQGENGFGYDPIFLVGERGETAAQLSAEEKNERSHRGQAMKKLLKELPDWLKE